MIYVASHINARSPTINGRSLPIFPCYPNKRPACANGFKDASTDPGWIAELWAGRTGLLVAVPTGEGSGISVLDIDDTGWPGLAALPPTRVHQTRGGGRHYIFRHRAGLRCSQSLIAPGVDVRADGGYVIWWPSAGFVVNGDAVIDWPDSLQTTPKTENDGSPPVDLTSSLPAPSTIAREVTHLRAFKKTVPRWSREETYAYYAARNARVRLALTPIGQKLRERTINAEAYALGRLVAPGWIGGDESFLWIWLGAQDCRYDRDHGTAATLRLIRRGMLAGMRLPYPDLGAKKAG